MKNNFYSNPDIEQYKLKYDITLGYGLSSTAYTADIHLLIKELNPKSILDYGCGNSGLVDRLKEVYPEIDFVRYDPALEKYNKLPIRKFDLVVCMDVLEHIRERYLYELLSYLSIIAKNAFFAISLAKAIHTLPNGDNCHCTLLSVSEWVYLIENYFDDIIYREPSKNTLVCITKNNE